MTAFSIFDAPEATAEEILRGREERAARQRMMLGEAGTCVLSFSMNIPGPAKRFALEGRAFEEGLGILRNAFRVLREDVWESNAGNNALLLIESSPDEAKRKVVAVENSHPVGRLFDIDVLRSDGQSVSRKDLGLPPRKCILCEKEAKLCGRSRAHSLEALRLQTERLLDDYYGAFFAYKFAAVLVRAMLWEVCITPKPGLVDRANSGAHSDMNFMTFMDSSAALAPWFCEFFRAGWRNAATSTEDLFAGIRFLGRRAEEAMFAATGGVNTHKGLLFSFCILSAAAGAIQKQDPLHPVNEEKLIALCQDLGAVALRDFDHLDVPATNGEEIYRMHRVKGVRGEAADGFPTVFSCALPKLKTYLQSRRSFNDAAVMTLMELLARVEDTNMIHRGGEALAKKIRENAERMLQAECSIAEVEELDRFFCEKNLSPGGCADLLCLTFAVYFAQEEGLMQ